MSATITQEEFHEQRRKYLGGSDISAVLGLSPWRTPVALWADKIKPRVESPESRDNRMAKSRGKRWESVVAEMLVEELQRLGHDVRILSSNCRYIDPEHDFFASEIDFELCLDNDPEIINCELKTVHPFKAKLWGESGSDELPVYYTAQGMWGLGVTGRNRCIIAPLFGADELRIFPIQRDDTTIVGMRSKALHFWTQHVLTQVAPPAIDIEDAHRLFAQEVEGKTLDADDELTGKILRLRALDKSIKAQQAEKDAIEFEVQMRMQDAAEIRVAGKSAITWKERPHTFLDQQALKDEHPKIHKAFTRKGASRVFLLKSFAWDGV